MSIVAFFVTLLTTRDVVADKAPHKEEPRVCFHDKIDFDGAMFCSAFGHEVADVEKVLVKGKFHNWIRRARSVRVIGKAKITLFDAKAFTGASLVLFRSEPDLSRVKTDRGMINWSNLMMSYKSAPM